MTPDIEILVAGAGAAGLAAAISAAERSAEVVVVEASERFREGSNTAMSTAMIPAAGTRWQRAAGITDSPDLFRSDIAAKSKGTAHAPTARALTEVSAELVAWLADTCDLPLSLVTDFNYPGHSAQRCHTLPDRSGRSLHAGLLAKAQSMPTIQFIVPMRLADVAETGDGPLRATISTPDGNAEQVTVGSVVLATNGYGANRDLIAEHIPGMANAHYHGSAESKGDAVLIGRRLGADLAYLDAFQGHGSLTTPHAVLLTWAVMVHGGILVNAEGRRFGNETTGYSEFGPLVAAQPESRAWAIFDERIGKLCEPFADYQDALSAGAIVRAADLDAAAGLVGCDPVALRDELTALASSRAGATADRFGRTEFGPGLEGPFLLARVTGALFHTQGGLLVDENATVLRDGMPVNGVYAAGGAAAGISGHGASGYLAGNGLLPALGLGYLAGRHAAEAVNR